MRGVSDSGEGGSAGGGVGSGSGGTSSPGLIPDRLNASDFTLYNTTPEMVQMFQNMLNRVQNNDPVGTALIKQQWLEGGRVVLNPLDGAVGKNIPDDIKAEMEKAPGIDFWSAETSAVFWNPYSALQVYDNSGNLLGINSPDVAYVHETGHAIDPNSMSHFLDKNPQYGNLGEFIAGKYEALSAMYLGEIVRPNHKGSDVLVDNTSTHTALVDGQLYWVKTNKDGVTEIGPKYDFQKIVRNYDAPGVAPKFGSTDPGHATDYNHPTPNDGNGSPLTPRNDDPSGPQHDGDDSGAGTLPGGDYPGNPDQPSGGPGENAPPDSGNGSGDMPHDWDDGSGGSNPPSGGEIPTNPDLPRDGSEPSTGPDYPGGYDYPGAGGHDNNRDGIPDNDGDPYSDPLTASQPDASAANAADTAMMASHVNAESAEFHAVFGDSIPIAVFAPLPEGEIGRLDLDIPPPDDVFIPPKPHPVIDWVTNPLDTFIGINDFTVASIVGVQDNTERPGF
jgi:hypothetical protein